MTSDDISLLYQTMEKCKIPFILTGTAALAIQGFVPSNYHPHDFDIIITLEGETNTQLAIDAIIKKIELESKCKVEYNDYYGSNFVYTFKLSNGTTVNAFANSNCKIVDALTYIGAFGETGRYTKISFAGLPQICVSRVSDVLKAKFKLKRYKDFIFAKDLISYIANIAFEKCYKPAVNKKL